MRCRLMIINQHVVHPLFFNILCCREEARGARVFSLMALIQPLGTPAHRQKKEDSASPVPVTDEEAASPPAAIQPAAPGTLALWAVWEWWCDFPVRRTGSAAKQQQVAPTWLDNVKSLGMFGTAEGFWGIHNCVVPPSRLPNGGNYYLFRHNIPPMWEHEANRRGGKWVVQFPVEQATECDRCWLDLCVACIGEQIPAPEEEICGAAVSKRRSGYKISLWTRNATAQSVQINAGFYIKVLLGLRTKGALKYVAHCAALGTAPTATSGSGVSPRSPDMRSSQPPATNDNNSGGNSPTDAPGSVGQFPGSPPPANNEPLYTL